MKQPAEMDTWEINERLLELDVAEERLRLELEKLSLERAELELVRHRIEFRKGPPTGRGFKYA